MSGIEAGSLCHISRTLITEDAEWAWETARSIMDPATTPEAVATLASSMVAAITKDRVSLRESSPSTMLMSILGGLPTCDDPDCPACNPEGNDD